MLQEQDLIVLHVFVHVYRYQSYIGSIISIVIEPFGLQSGWTPCKHRRVGVISLFTSAAVFSTELKVCPRYEIP
jgi:hypothetical protein